MSDVAAKTCEGCGEGITSEQIVNRQAGLVHGVLLCPACVEKKRREAMEMQRAAAAAEEKLTLEGSDESAAGPSSNKIRSFAAGSTLAGAHHDAKLKRKISGATEAATRIRTFHSKLTPAALAHMDDQINEWIDANPDVYIKSVNTTVGPFEAKHVEHHLIVTVFY